MSDMFTVEIALATIPMGLLETGGAGQVEVLVGGSGLDTADAILGFQSVASLTIVEYHPRSSHGTKPVCCRSTRLSDDPRCRFVGAFFDMARRDAGFDPAMPTAGLRHFP